MSQVPYLLIFISDIYALILVHLDFRFSLFSLLLKMQTNLRIIFCRIISGLIKTSVISMYWNSQAPFINPCMNNIKKLQDILLIYRILLYILSNYLEKLVPCIEIIMDQIIQAQLLGIFLVAVQNKYRNFTWVIFIKNNKKYKKLLLTSINKILRFKSKSI